MHFAESSPLSEQSPSNIGEQTNEEQCMYKIYYAISKLLYKI